MNIVGFSYGVLADGLEKQANEQGYTFGDDIKFVEDLRHAYNMGVFYFLTDKEKGLALKKINKKIINCIKPLN